MKKELRDGLLLRSLSEGIASDYHNLGQFYVDIFAKEGDEDAEMILPYFPKCRRKLAGGLSKGSKFEISLTCFLG